MDNYFMGPRSEEVASLSLELGFARTFFLGTDFIIVSGAQKKQILRLIQQGRQRKMQVFYRPASEEMLRFVLERTPVDGVIGIEQVHPKDSLHFVRSGLDQILCEIAARQGKKIVFSFHEILNSVQKSSILRRVAMNIRVCRKYNVQAVLSTFSGQMEELRAASDLGSLWRVLGG